MNLPKLYVIADFETCKASTDDFAPLLDRVESTLAAGAKLIQLRAPTVSPEVFWDIGAQVSALVGAYGAKLLVNDRADLAFAVDADGVHLPSHGLPVHAVRRIFEQDWVGVSCHDLDGAQTAQADRATFVTMSPVFESDSKPGRPGNGVDWLSEICGGLSVPVFALSGVTPERVDECLRAGAHGVAVMSGIMGSSPDDVYQQTLRYLAELV